MLHQFRTHGMKATLLGFGLFMLGLSVVATAADFGSALSGAANPTQKAKAGARSVAAGIVPSGAVTYLGQVDQALDRMDRMMSDKTGNFTKADRAKSAEAALMEAKEKMDLIENRYGAKMGKQHPDLVKRQDRIASGEKAVETFKGAMGDAIQKEKDTREARDKEATTLLAAQKEKEAAQRQAENQQGPAPAGGAGTVVFSTAPIDPAKPAGLTSSFKAGDTIYGLIQAAKTWRELYEAKNKTELGLMIVMAIGESQTKQCITLQKAAYIDSPQLVLDIAPAPEKMTAYRDPAIQFGEGKGHRKIGPIAFTYELGQLPPGKHKIQFFILNYGDKLAAGEFELEGTDFKYYADLHEKVKAASEAISTLPPAGMVNRELEIQMRKLAANAGWGNILRVVIIDKDWWLEGSTSRYLNVAVAAKGADGKCFWSNLQFSQPKLITGAWGALDLTKTGIKRNIAEENVNQ